MAFAGDIFDDDEWDDAALLGVTVGGGAPAADVTVGVGAPAADVTVGRGAPAADPFDDDDDDSALLGACLKLEAGRDAPRPAPPLPTPARAPQRAPFFAEPAAGVPAASPFLDSWQASLPEGFPGMGAPGAAGAPSPLQGGPLMGDARGTETCYKCGQPGHWARDCPNAPAAPQVEGPPCPCGAGPCTVRTSNSAANPGRQFAKCPLAEPMAGGSNGCGYFGWLDSDGAPNGASSGNPAKGDAPYGRAASGTCFKCGQVGHWPRDCPGAVPGTAGPPQAAGFGFGAPGPAALGFGAPAEGPPCPCGAGPCTVLTSNSEKNPGRQFAKCPTSSVGGGNGCGYFAWMDSLGGDAGGGALAGGAPQRDSGGSGGACFKCGQPGHWARDCPDAGTSKGTGKRTSKKKADANPAVGHNSIDSYFRSNPY